MMKIVYYHTLYKKVITQLVCGDIEFKHIGNDDVVVFKSGGHGYLVNTKYIKRIEEER